MDGRPGANSAKKYNFWDVFWSFIPVFHRKNSVCGGKDRFSGWEMESQHFLSEVLSILERNVSRIMIWNIVQVIKGGEIKQDNRFHCLVSKTFVWLKTGKDRIPVHWREIKMIEWVANIWKRNPDVWTDWPHFNVDCHTAQACIQCMYPRWPSSWQPHVSQSWMLVKQCCESFDPFWFDFCNNGW